MLTETYVGSSVTKSTYSSALLRRGQLPETYVLYYWWPVCWYPLRQTPATVYQSSHKGALATNPAVPTPPKPCHQYSRRSLPFSCTNVGKKAGVSSTTSWRSVYWY